MRRHVRHSEHEGPSLDAAIGDSDDSVGFSEIIGRSALDNSVETDDLIEVVSRILTENFSERDAKILTLKLFHERKQKEIAEQFDLPMGTVDPILKRGKDRLAKFLRKAGY